MIVQFLFSFFIFIYSQLFSSSEYSIQDIGTLQARWSEAIDLNNEGEMIGLFNVDGTHQYFTYFFREENGRFHTIPSIAEDNIDWQFLTDAGEVYGLARNALYLWTKYSKPKKIADLPNGRVLNINNSGEVLISDLSEETNGKTIFYSVIWKNGAVKRLHGLGGNLGLQAKRVSAFCLNNEGNAVGFSQTSNVYKNEIQQDSCSTYWQKNEVIDLHKLLPKCTFSHGLAINDRGDCYIQSDAGNFIINSEKECYVVPFACDKISDSHAYSADLMFDLKDKKTASIHAIGQKVTKDPNSFWWKVNKIVKINNRGEIIAQGTTMQGEQHAMIIKQIN